jgi:hypothetical protein
MEGMLVSFVARDSGDEEIERLLFDFLDGIFAAALMSPPAEARPVEAVPTTVPTTVPQPEALPTRVPPPEALPTEVPPAEVPSAEVLPAEALPAEAPPAQVPRPVL